jgi:hypothetical protein
LRVLFKIAFVPAGIPMVVALLAFFGLQVMGATAPAVNGMRQATATLQLYRVLGGG